jgi:GNAT superfamily N-acetyltransferase
MIARSPADDDFREVLALVTASDRALIGDTDWTEHDLRRQWHDVDLTRDAWMVELGDRLGGYATFEDRGGGRLIVEGYVHPELLRGGVGSELIRVTEEPAVAEVPQYAAAPRVYIQNATADASERTAGLYERAGMRVFHRMTLYEKELRGRGQTS